MLSFLIDTMVSLSTGMADIVKLVNGLSNYAFHAGMKPIVNLRGENQYISSTGDNMWEYYFEQPHNIISRIDDGDYHHSDGLMHSISSSDSQLGFSELFYSPQFSGLIDEDNGFIRFNHHMKSEIQCDPVINSIKDIVDDGKKILGVILRGSDKTIGKLTDEYVTCVLKNLEQIENYDYYFLASEDQFLFDSFMQQYADRTIFFPQKRSQYDYSQNPFVVVGATGELESGRLWGEKYLKITYALSLCTGLAYNINAGTRWLANLWKNSRSECFESYYSIGSVFDVIPKKVFPFFLDFLTRTEQIFVYGTGQVAESLFMLQMSTRILHG